MESFKVFNAHGSFLVMRRDAENCPSCLLEQCNFETHFLGTFIFSRVKRQKNSYGHKVIRWESIL